MIDQPDLDFGAPLPPLPVKPLRGGYARRPGGGPDGETCGSCAHLVRRGHHDKTYFKCSLVAETRGPGTDIRKRSPACELWGNGGEA
jgi:hypothetical protein